MGRNYLTGRDGDRINAVLAAAGYNFSLLLRWFEELLLVLLLIICRSRSPRLLPGPLHLTRCRKTFFTADPVAFEIRDDLMLQHDPRSRQVPLLIENPLPSHGIPIKAEIPEQRSRFPRKRRRLTPGRGHGPSQARDH